MPDYQDILYGVDDHVATITINRPKKLNAFTQKTFYEWEDALRRAEADRDVGVIVFGRRFGPRFWRCFSFSVRLPAERMSSAGESRWTRPLQKSWRLG